MYSVCVVFIYFILYSFIGWACETVWCSIGSKKLVNRGFLIGPLCPIYGFGGLLVIYLLRPYSENMVTVFLAGMVLTSVLEYITSVLLEKLFKLKLWDYSTYFCNINGRVCLKNSILFGVMATALTWFIHPFFEKELAKISHNMVYIIASVMFVVIAVDCFITVKTVLKLNKHIEELRELLSELSEELSARAETAKSELEEKVRVGRDKAESYAAMLEEDFSTLKDMVKADSIRKLKEGQSFLQKRFVNAYPHMSDKDSRLAEIFSEIKEKIADWESRK